MQIEGKSPESRKPAGKKGLAPIIRRLKTKFPEMTDSAIARRVGCRPSNVTQVLSRYLGDHSGDDLRNFQENQADIVDSLKMRVVESISAKKLEKSSAAQLTTMYGILYDKGALLRGQPTGINVTALLDVARAIKERQQ